jgi:tetratricopeptide (TPR) repeat protein
MMIDAGDYPGALTALRKHLVIHPNDHEANYWVATTLFKANRGSEAEAVFRRLTTNRPDDDRCAYGLALSLLQLGRTEEARIWLETALAKNPRLERARKKLDELNPRVQRNPEFQQQAAHPERRGTLVGQARRVRLQTRSDPWITRGQIFTLTFLLERRDPSGQPLPPVSVQLEASLIEGQPPAEGDWVRVPGHAKPGKQLEVTEFRNLTTDLLVRARRGQRTLVLAMLVLLFLGFIAFAVSIGR